MSALTKARHSRPASKLVALGWLLMALALAVAATHSLWMPLIFHHAAMHFHARPTGMHYHGRHLAHILAMHYHAIVSRMHLHG